MLRRTSASWRRGVRLPGSRANSSSRGKKPGSTGRANRVATCQMKLLTAVGLEGAGLGAAVIERVVAVGTERRRRRRGLSPDGAGAAQGQVFEHARPHTREARIEFGLDLAQGRFRMENAPLAHLTGDFLGSLLPQRH